MKASQTYRCCNVNTRSVEVTVKIMNLVRIHVSKPKLTLVHHHLTFYLSSVLEKKTEEME